MKVIVTRRIVIVNKFLKKIVTISNNNLKILHKDNHQLMYSIIFLHDFLKIFF